MELSERRIIGTCEAQICRSCGPWSIGTPNKVEHSIQSAYVKAIQCSDHFVYIENQFFITSCIVEGTVITNKIGDALVNRIIQAHEEGTPWKAVIVMPTMPGYPSPLNEDAAGSVRLIVDCQYKSICRGETSIFGRLRAEGINPNDYINFFSLRGWGKLKTGQLTTEGVYIHAKAMIVDDRCVIIGSANINERSQRGDRDSELACVIRDTDMIDSKMAGKPYKVGRFAHTMRVRLMREHLGIDVDAIDAEDANMDLIDHQTKTQEEPSQHHSKKASLGSQTWDPDREERERTTSREGITQLIPPGTRFVNGIKSIGQSVKEKLDPHSNDPDRYGDPESNISFHDQILKQAHENPQVAKGKDQSKNGEAQPTSRLVPTLEEIDRPISTTGDLSSSGGANSTGRPPVIVQPDYLETAAPNNGKARSRSPTEESNPNLRSVDPHGFEDPIDDKFYDSVWTAIASRNTQIFRTVFKCLPDDKVTTWQGYKEFTAWENRHGKPLKESIVRPTSLHSSAGNGNPEDDHSNLVNPAEQQQQQPGAGGNLVGQQPIGKRARGMSVASGATTIGGGGNHKQGEGHNRSATTTSNENENNPTSSSSPSGLTSSDSRKKSIGSFSKSNQTSNQKSAPDDRSGFSPVERDQMEELLTEVQGHLGLWKMKILIITTIEVVGFGVQLVTINDKNLNPKLI
ncbi:hypothetical protein H4Q26_017608 [Puccinia striiformis f. sp. tritici PST-130]|nr:hypothetical protein H4Q26_017608 [Puccinia striiformis f. sp. tritici PST-130]